MRHLAVAVCLLAASSARAAPDPHPRPEDAWLTALTDRVIADLAAGRPLVAEVHVPLCDSSIIPCGNAKLGDGDNPDTNLYWSTTPGFGEWFRRRGSGWKRVLAQGAAATGDPDILAVHVYRRTLRAPAAWRKRGAPATFELDLVIHGWRGKAIDRALARYAADVSGSEARMVALPDGTQLAAGGAAQLVAWVGHNRLMDLDSYAWPAATTPAKGNIAIACHTAAYMADRIADAARVPLLMTRDFLFSNAAPLEATVLAFAAGGDYARMRADATAAYAEVQQRPLAKMAGVFTNPADRRWGR